MGNDVGKLEPPRLFRRKKTSTPQAPGPLNEPLEREESTAGAEPDAVVEAPEVDATVDVPVAEPGDAVAGDLADGTQDVGDTGDAGRTAGARDTVHAEDTEDTEDTAVQEPVHEPSPEPAPERAPEPIEAPTAVLPSQEPAQTADEPAAAFSGALEEQAPARRPRPPRVRRPLNVNGHVAALIGGVVAGVLLAGLTWAAEAANDTESNRTAALMLLAIFVISVVAGTLTLRALKVASPGTIAFLGTALVAVLAVVALGGHLDEAVGAIGVFLMSVAAYPLARWVTVRYIDEAA